MEVPNPSEYLMQGRLPNEAGSVVACTMEGSRPFLLEVQALVCQTSFPMPRRTAVGTDYNRVNLLMAVTGKANGGADGRLRCLCKCSRWHESC